MPGTGTEAGVVAYWGRDAHASITVHRIASVIVVETRSVDAGHARLLDRRPGVGWQRMWVHSEGGHYRLGTVRDGVVTVHAEISVPSARTAPWIAQPSDPFFGLYHLGAPDGATARFEQVRFCTEARGAQIETEVIAITAAF